MVTGNLKTEVENRSTARHASTVTAVVQLRDSETEAWKEVCEITNISRNGASLVLKRECPVGRLLSLVIQMPRDLRLYDLDEKVYPMLAVVQNCYEMTVDDKLIFNVGVAFIGKQVPATFKTDPRQCYRITGMNAEGLWEIVEAATQFKARKHSRFWRRIEITVSIRDERTKTTTKVWVFTREISAAGMSVWGPLDVKIGDRVKLASKDHDFFAIAVVRNRTTNDEDEKRSIIHLEFEEVSFPVDTLHVSATRTETLADDPDDEPYADLNDLLRF